MKSSGYCSFKDKKISVSIKKHAIDQVRNRTFAECDMSDEDIRKFLIKIVLKGKKGSRRPGENIYKISHEGHAVVARILSDKVEVITYLGNHDYQLWYNDQELKLKYRTNKRLKKSFPEELR